MARVFTEKFMKHKIIIILLIVLILVIIFGIIIIYKKMEQKKTTAAIRSGLQNTNSQDRTINHPIPKTDNSSIISSFR